VPYTTSAPLRYSILANTAVRIRYEGAVETT
jgi:hypothetical protein